MSGDLARASRTSRSAAQSSRTGAAPDAPEGASPDAPPTVSTAAPVLPILSGLLAAGTAAAVIVGWTSTAGESAIVAAATVATLALALPAHRAAVIAWGEGSWAPMVACLAALAAWGATLQAAATGNDLSVAAAATAAAAVVVIAHHAGGFTQHAGIGTARALVRWYPAAVLVGSVAVAAGWLLTGGGSGARDAGVAAMVAATPAVLLLAGPVALSVARGSVRRIGITLPDAAAVRTAAAADTLVIDLDGTVTTGAMRVVSVQPIEPDHDRNLRWFAGALAHESDDPVARAIARLAGRGRLRNVEQIPDRGITGSVDRHPVRLGSATWLGVTRPETIWTVVGVEVDHRVLGTLTVADEVRDDAAEAVMAAQRLGVRLVAVSTSTSERAHDVATEAGLNDVEAACTAQGAAARVADCQTSGERVVTAGPLVAGLGEVPDVATRLGLRDVSLRRVTSALRACRGCARGASAAEATVAVLGIAGLGLAAAGLIGPLLAAAWAAGSTGVGCAVAAARVGRD